MVLQILTPGGLLPGVGPHCSGGAGCRVGLSRRLTAAAPSAKPLNRNGSYLARATMVHQHDLCRHHKSDLTSVDSATIPKNADPSTRQPNRLANTPSSKSPAPKLPQAEKAAMTLHGRNLSALLDQCLSTPTGLPTPTCSSTSTPSEPGSSLRRALAAARAAKADVDVDAVAMRAHAATPEPARQPTVTLEGLPPIAFPLRPARTHSAKSSRSGSSAHTASTEKSKIGSRMRAALAHGATEAPHPMQSLDAHTPEPDASYADTVQPDAPDALEARREARDAGSSALPSAVEATSEGLAARARAVAAAALDATAGHSTPASRAARRFLSAASSRSVASLRSAASSDAPSSRASSRTSLSSACSSSSSSSRRLSCGDSSAACSSKVSDRSDESVGRRLQVGVLRPTKSSISRSLLAKSSPSSGTLLVVPIVPSSIGGGPTIGGPPTIGGGPTIGGPTIGGSRSLASSRPPTGTARPRAVSSAASSRSVASSRSSFSSRASAGTDASSLPAGGGAAVAALSRALFKLGSPEVVDENLHPHLQAQMLELYQEWKRQQSEGCCKVDRFDELLKLKFASEAPSARRAMLKIVRAIEARKEAAEIRRQATELDLQAVFSALDTDSHGSIEMGEFMQLSKLTGLSKAQLKRIFNERDVDQSGSLDHDEFRALIAEQGFAQLLEQKDAIKRQGDVLKEAYEIEERAKVCVCVRV
jgi:hypothetical protein